MRKCYKFNREDYLVLKKLIKKKKLPKQVKKLTKFAIKSTQDYLGFKKKFQIIFSYQESENFGEFFGIIKNKGRLVIYLNSIESLENSDEILIRTIIHEYLHYYFLKKKLNRIFSIEKEEELIELIEEDIWREYFT